jgi:hypothetical protein
VKSIEPIGRGQLVLVLEVLLVLMMLNYRP